MPFTSVNDLRPNPDVRIFFVGQLILEPLVDAKGCEVFVNRSAPDHFLSVEVRLKRPNRPDEILMRHVGPLPFIPTPVEDGSEEAVPARHGMFIFTEPPAKVGKDATQQPLQVKGYNGVNTSVEGEELDLALNMRRIHDVLCGAVEPGGGRPSILLNEGVFYTADTYPAGAILQKKQPGSLPKPQPKFASVIGANIYLLPIDKAQGAQQSDQPTYQHVMVSWRNNGEIKNLPLKKLPDVSYEIYITNEPLYQDDSIDAPATHEEFSEFYKILPQVPSHEQFVLKTPTRDSDRGSLRTPCMSVLLDQ